MFFTDASCLGALGAAPFVHERSGQPAKRDEGEIVATSATYW
jgi:hypothetical protein